MSIKDDSFEMLDLGLEKSKKPIYLVFLLILLLGAGAISVYFWQQRKVINLPAPPASTSIAPIPPAPSASPAPAPTPAPTKKVPTPVNIVINFDSDSAEITPAQLAKLETLEQLIKDTPGTMQISAYTDAMGSPQRGQVLSEQRAQAVVAAIKASGASAKIIYNMNWYGELFPVAPNTTEQGRALNRRVEIYFAPTP
ncbi:MAG: OmpA family protein [Firmicutes bacterium]|nr:OmpA family protein [Bacillota bacterium]